MDSFVEGTLEWSALTEEGLAELAELRTAIEYFDDPVERQSYDELVEYYRAPDADPQHNAVVGRDRGGTIVAYAWNHVRGLEVGEPRIWMDGGVHPAWRHQMIGRRLVEWQLARGQEWYAEALAADPELSQPLWLGSYVDAKLEGQAHLIEHCGFQAQRWYFDMHLSFSGADGGPFVLPRVPELHGVQLVPYHPTMSEQVRLAHNEAFADSPGVHTVSRASWEHSMARSAARPEWSWVAVVDGEVVGYAMNSAYVQDWQPQGFSEGWTDRLGVRPGWRGHQLGSALLVASVRSFMDAGLEGAGLGVDTSDPSGAVDLFTGIGYESEEMVVLYGREFSPPGRTG